MQASVVGHKVAIASLVMLVAVAVPDQASPRAATARDLDNLMAFTHLFGVVRHFAPTEAARTTNWDDFAIVGVRAVESARSPEALAKQLQTLFSAVAPAVRVTLTNAGAPTDAGAPVTPSSIAVATWVNAGIGTGGCDPRLTFRSEIVVRPALRGLVPPGLPQPSQPWRGSLGSGLSASLPLAQWVALPVEEGARCLPVQPTAPVEPATSRDRATRLAGIVIAWNVLRHSYPYFDIAKTDWFAALRTALASAATDSTPVQYLMTLERMMAALGDGQAQVVANIPKEQTAYLPVRFDWVEDHLVVDVVTPGALVLRRGDVVTTLDGVLTEEALRARELLIPAATAQRRRHRAVTELVSGPMRGALNLGVRPAGGGTEREVRLFYEGPLLERPRPAKVAEVKPGIMYVDLSRTTPADFAEALPALAAAQGIVFDVREAPMLDTHDVLPWLSDADVRLEFASQAGATSAFRAGLPRASFPFLEEAVWLVPPAELIAPKRPRIAAKVAVLTGPGAISGAETIVGAVKQNNLGEIVGSATAGTNGLLNSVTIPGGLTIRFTAFRSTKPDGTSYHGAGVKPTVPALRTLEGVIAGRDEVLEAGIAVVGKSPGQR